MAKERWRVKKIGIEKERLEMARKMKIQGVAVDIISEVSGLAAEKILAL